MKTESSFRSSKEDLRERLLACGFDLAGFAPTALPEQRERLLAWLAAGRHAAMAWMERDPENRVDVRRRWPEARSVVCLALSYHTDEADRGEAAGPGRGWISRYAWGKDYHKRVKKRLIAACRVLEEEGAELARPYVDTGPLLERGFHAAAGTGWLGKNACLIHPKWGSWLFLGEVVTDLEIVPDRPVADHCASCTACLEACPTDALVGSGELDARLCISYQTIENREAIPPALHEAMEDHLFGCDICQEVCPWNFHAPVPDREPFRARPQSLAPELAELAELDEEGFDERFAGSAVRRARWEGFLRNVAVALGNEGSTEAEAILERLAEHDSPLVREHAEIALQRLAAKG